MSEGKRADPRADKVSEEKPKERVDAEPVVSGEKLEQFKDLTTEEERKLFIKTYDENPIVKNKVNKALAMILTQYQREAGKVGTVNVPKEYRVPNVELANEFRNKKGQASPKKIESAIQQNRIRFSKEDVANIFLPVFSVDEPLKFTERKSKRGVLPVLNKWDTEKNEYVPFGRLSVKDIGEAIKKNMTSILPAGEGKMPKQYSKLGELLSDVLTGKSDRVQLVDEPEPKKPTAEPTAEPTLKPLPTTTAPLRTATEEQIPQPTEKASSDYSKMPESQLRTLISKRLALMGLTLPSPDVRSNILLDKMVKDIRAQGEGFDGVVSREELAKYLRESDFRKEDFIPRPPVGAEKETVRQKALADPVSKEKLPEAGEVVTQPVAIPENIIYTQSVGADQIAEKDRQIGGGWHVNEANKGTQRPKYITPSVNVLQPSEQDIQADFDEWAIFDFVQPINNYGAEGNLVNNPLKRMARVEEETRFRNAGIDLQPALSSVYTNREVDDSQSQMALDMLPPLIPDTSNQPRQVYNVSEYEVKSYDVNNDRTQIEYQSPYDNMTPIVLTNDGIRRSVLYGRVP